MTSKPAHLQAFYADEPSVTIEQIVETIRYELKANPDHGYSHSERLRSAVFFLPESMPVADWVKACAVVGINAGSARNRFREVRQNLKAGKNEKVGS